MRPYWKKRTPLINQTHLDIYIPPPSGFVPVDIDTHGQHTIWGWRLVATLPHTLTATPQEGTYNLGQQGLIVEGPVKKR